jgi:hypothetical protein
VSSLSSDQVEAVDKTYIWSIRGGRQPTLDFELSEERRREAEKAIEAQITSRKEPGKEQRLEGTNPRQG